MTLPARFVLDVEACARCGGAHPSVAFDPLTRPMLVAGAELTHWAACPAGGEPILAQESTLSLMAERLARAEAT